jgi:hypothetical protein
MGWLDAGIVERANSPYNSHIFCVPKKQGHGLRCILNFRRLNLKTMDSKYSIRCIDQCLEEVGKAGSKIFSCLDMRNGFWNQVLCETDRHYTAFTIPGIGQLQRTVTAQGLCGAPAAFSRLMDTIMEDRADLRACYTMVLDRYRWPTISANDKVWKLAQLTLGSALPEYIGLEMEKVVATNQDAEKSVVLLRADHAWEDALDKLNRTISFPFGM